MRIGYYYFMNHLVPSAQIPSTAYGHPPVPSEVERCRPSVLGALLLTILLTLSSCSEDGWTDKKENFTQTYMEILVAREQIQDSIKADSEVSSVMAKHGFDQRSFGQQFMEYSRTPEVLKAIMDSAQRRAQRELKR